ncbi:MAG: hypothetical protein LAP85_03165 [Acidobacteriia bacterium]|nr:hypothetical protein [Terriglobia bacterium]
MSVVGRISVRETRGIRRFLYPLSTELHLPEVCRAQDLGLIGRDGQPVPMQVTPAGDNDAALFRLDFAVSMAPLETVELRLGTGQPAFLFDDPLRISTRERLRSEQLRFAIELDLHGRVHDVVYDEVRHLRAPSLLTRNGAQAELLSSSACAAGLSLAARITAAHRYADGCHAQTRAEITACKSWLSLVHVLQEPQPGDEVVFALPLAVGAQVLTCDFGVGGGIYGKLQSGVAAEIVWHTDFSAGGAAQWSLLTAGRIDHRGSATSPEEYLPQRWFHCIDRNKALAVAITAIPNDCRTMTVTLRATGDVVVSCKLGDLISGPAAFGVCYHFLNDIPPLAAATNPQSILLPPQVHLDL